MGEENPQEIQRVQKRGEREVMDLSELIFTELGEHTVDIELFDCGRDDINDFFRNDAAAYQGELFSKTYFFCLPDNPSRVVAAFGQFRAELGTKTTAKCRFAP